MTDMTRNRRLTAGALLRQPFCMFRVAFRLFEPPSVSMGSSWRIIATVAMCAGIAACSSPWGDGASGFASTTSRLSTSSTTSPLTTAPTGAEPTTSIAETTTTVAAGVPTAAELGLAISAFWELFVGLGASKVPFDPAIRQRLEERTTGAELTTLFNVFQSNALAGYYVRGAISSSITVVSASAAEAEVRDCYDDTTGLYRISNDERVDADDPARHQVVYTLLNEGAAWKVSRILDEGLGCVVSS